jgi:hypothetical protein
MQGLSPTAPTVLLHREGAWEFVKREGAEDSNGSSGKARSCMLLSSRTERAEKLDGRLGEREQIKKPKNPEPKKNTN